MRPRKPEHADKVEAIAGADSRLAVRRRLVQYSYPQNGNLHNATPEYFWDLLLDGRMVDTSRLKRDMVEAAREHGADYLNGRVNAW